MAPPQSRAHANRLASRGVRLAVIVAVASNGAIGAGGALPWRLPADLARFRALTSGHAVVMGRRTWTSIGRALPGRQNIVVTRSRGFAAPGAEVAHSLDDALALVRLPAPAFCIGGAELYRDALSRADVLYVTEIHRAIPGDTFFPAIDRRAWHEALRERHPPDGPQALAFDFVTYHRTSAESAATGAPRAD